MSLPDDQTFFLPSSFGVSQGSRRSASGDFGLAAVGGSVFELAGAGAGAVAGAGAGAGARSALEDPALDAGAAVAAAGLGSRPKAG